MFRYYVQEYSYYVIVSVCTSLKQNKTEKNSDIDTIIHAYKDHISIKKINKTFSSNRNINFNIKTVSCDEVRNIIKNLNSKKGALSESIPANVLKDYCEVYLPFLTKIINDCITNSIIPAEMKLAEIIPVFKKIDPLDKKNYRPISLLSHLSKIIEKIIFNQISNFMEERFSNLLTGFRKNHNTQDSLIKMIESWKKALDNNKNIGIIFMDLSKAFDTLNHDLLLAKLNAYGFTKKAIKLLSSYLSNRHQRTNINQTFSLWEEIISGVPQGSILGPLLFNIFINDIFFFTVSAELCNYADDNTLYAINKDIEIIHKCLRQNFNILTNWFYENHMVLNPDKCHYMYMGKNSKSQTNFQFENNVIEHHNTEEILGIIIDNQLSFTPHIKKLCKKAGNKLNALARISGFLSNTQKKTLFNSFIKGQFNYCPLIWMFCSRSCNSMINRVHQRSLKLIYNYNANDASFENLLMKANEVNIHVTNLQRLMTHMYKCVNNLAPPISRDTFIPRQNPHNIRNFREFCSFNNYTVKYGTETVLYRAPQLWQQLPQEIKESKTLAIFKIRIKQWKTPNCQCRLCKLYVPDLGFID